MKTLLRLTYFAILYGLLTLASPATSIEATNSTTPPSSDRSK